MADVGALAVAVIVGVPEAVAETERATDMRYDVAGEMGPTVEKVTVCPWTVGWGEEPPLLET